MNKNLLIYLIASTFLSGCPLSLRNQGHQEISVITTNNVNGANTTCDLRNAKGHWTTSPEKNIVIKQDELPIYIRCENNKQWGASQANLIIENQMLWQNWYRQGVTNLIENTVQGIARDPGGCFLFCDVFDFVNDSQYKYPRYVYLEMNNR